MECLWSVYVSGGYLCSDNVTATLLLLLEVTARTDDLFGYEPAAFQRDNQKLIWQPFGVVS